MLVEEFKTMGVSDSLTRIKRGGKIGIDTIDYTANSINLCSIHSQCPATVSVLGAMTSQEVIKAITHVHMPISQFLVFESFNSLPTSPQKKQQSNFSSNDTINAVYGSEIAAVLSRLKVFVVGAGAIGSELLKNFALLGIGTQMMDLDDTISYTGDSMSLWQQYNLSRGGVIVTDMDHIERSNLNRQLLFR
jgi:ubiquitin-activating enzyme E1